MKGEWLGLRKTDDKIKIPGINIDKVLDGKIVEHGGTANTFESLWEKSLIRPY